MTQTVLARTAPNVAIDGTPAVPADEGDELRNLFAAYNPTVWPAHLVAYALGLLAVGSIVRRPGRRTDASSSGCSRPPGCGSASCSSDATRPSSTPP
jgi:hypothetical protein